MAAQSAAIQPLHPVLQKVSESELSEKIKELVRLAREQGHLTYNDLNEVLPEDAVTPELLDEVFSKLRTLEIEITHQAEVDRVKIPDAEEEDTNRLNPNRTKTRRRGASTFWTTRCACISSKWARWRC
jgi:hypothetical protein